MFGPRRPMPPRVTYGAASFMAQYAACRRFEQECAGLDAREDECWRMFGITVEYVMDERIIRCV